MIATLFILLVAYQLKHWLADYPLQRPWMLGKFKEGWAFVPPLAAHAFVHGTFTFLIALVARHDLDLACALAGFDFVIHFAMDRIKASPKLMGRWKPLTGKEYEKTMGWLKDFKGFSSKDAYRQSTIVKERGEKLASLRSNRMFWHSLGIDQMVHHLTHYAIIACLVLS